MAEAAARQHSRNEPEPGNLGGDSTRHEHVPPGTPIAPIEGLAALNPVQTDAWLELVEIVFGEPFSPET